jgi:hypothetical protein
MSMLNMYPRLQLQASSVDDDADENVHIDRHGASIGYGIAVVCVTIFVFCVLVSSSFSAWKACASASLVALLLIVAACFAPKRWFHHRSQRPGASAELVVTVTAAGAARPGYPCPQVDVPPAFAFECPALEAGGGGEREREPTAASCVVCCSVCLEDVRGGEMVRQLPACMHLFHMGCIDMWLHSHRTCPMCRCVISPVAAGAPKAAAEEAPESSDDGHDLPPV